MKWIQHITYWTLFSVLFAQIIGSSILYNLYSIDQETFIELLCENKDKPELKCDGKCMLSKLNEQEKEETENKTVPPSLQVQINFFICSSVAQNISALNYIEIGPIIYNQDSYASPLLDALFRPPILV